MKKLLKKVFGRLTSRLDSESDELAARKHAYNIATKHHLFDVDWYQAHYGEFTSSFAAFNDYLDKSSFSNANPSPHFDTESYLRNNIDIYHEGTSPLLHYTFHGMSENRRSSGVNLRWHPKDVLLAKETETWAQQKIAICLHIFYADFVEKFAVCIEHFPCDVDMFVAVSTEKIKRQVELSYASEGKVGKLKVVVAPNRGRNFGPVLVEFGRELLEYDLMCHLHSKKSLYSGREQTQWFDYLNQYLFKDQHVVNCVLRLFDEQPELGMYYPTSFWMMPSWVNHWTCNRSFAEDFIKSWDLDTRHNFINYPVGGMFWARPNALKQLLEKDYEYEDFPEEPLPNDGSWLHALERVLGLLVEKNDYKQFYYYPPSGQFTLDKSYVFTNYRKSPEQLFSELRNFEVISFDVFDTVLRREFTEPDYAKFVLGKHLTEQGIVPNPESFIKHRNDAEYQLRKDNGFVGDVDIVAVYERLAEVLVCDIEQASVFMEMEFNIDLEFVSAKDEMVTLVQQLSDLGRTIWFITDTYYTQNQVEILLRKIGIAVPYKLFVSSQLNMRKDSGTMWSFIREKIVGEKVSHIHVGDNVRADAQICGDFGLANMHILHPVDKWQAAGFPAVLTEEQAQDEQHIAKWGKLVSNFGRFPFFGD